MSDNPLRPSHPKIGRLMAIQFDYAVEAGLIEYYAPQAPSSVGAQFALISEGDGANTLINVSFKLAPGEDAVQKAYSAFSDLMAELAKTSIPR